MENDWTPIYGDFDCEANAAAYWLHVNGICPEAFIRYNWDFYYDEEEDLLRGCIQVPHLIEWLRTRYRLHVTELSFDELPHDELVIIPGNAYWLPYAPEYYMTQRLVHYYPARKARDGTIKVWDPIFNNMGGEVSEEIVRKAFGDLDRTALWLRKTPSFVSEEEAPLPHIVLTDYEAAYREAVNRVLPRIGELLDRQGDLKKDLDYKRYFGNIQSILIGRERYFQTAPSSLADNIANAWRNVSKQYMRLSYLRRKGWDAFVGSITAAVQEEIVYLSGLTKSNEGGHYMHQEHLKDEIVTMLAEILEAPIEDSDVDLSSHGMNSMKAIQLIVELETRYDIEFEDSELLLKNFNTIHNIMSKMEEKLGNLTV